MTKRSTPEASNTPVLNAVRAQLAALYQEMIEDRARLERQRRRVDKVLFDQVKATEPRAMLSAMEQAYSLKEIWRDHLIEASGELDHGPRLHAYDVAQRAQRFGVSGNDLRQAVLECGPELERVKAVLASKQDQNLLRALAMDGASVQGTAGAAQKGANSPRRKEEKTNG